jgi:hypothetical protein
MENNIDISDKYNINFNPNFNLTHFLKTGDPKFVLEYIPSTDGLILELCLKYVPINSYVLLDWLRYYFHTSKLQFLTKIIRSINIDHLITLLTI